MNSTIMAKINAVNADISRQIDELAANRESNFDKAEELASSLLELIDKRQSLLNKLDDSSPREVELFLDQQKTLGQDFIDKLTEHRKFYYDAITKMKAGSQKVGLYQSVNKNR